jgi:hypothetical protein
MNKKEFFAKLVRRRVRPTCGEVNDEFEDGFGAGYIVASFPTDEEDEAEEASWTKKTR